MSEPSRQLKLLVRPSRRRHFHRYARAFAGASVFALSLLAVSGAGAISKLTHSATGRAYAASLFSRIPLPSDLTRLDEPLEPLHAVTGNPGFSNLIDIVRYYHGPSSMNVVAFTRTHFPKGEWEGSGSTVDGGYHISASASALSLCGDRHASYCGVTYSERALSSGGEELRVDVVVVWMPIHVVLVPSSGVVTVTGYNRLSLVFRSSEPTHVQLTKSQTSRLRRAVAVLRTSPGGLCMEDSTLYTITVASAANAKPFWSASADECPGQLTVTFAGRQVLLDARSCPLETLVASFFPSHAATGTKQDLSVCLPTE